MSPLTPYPSPVARARGTQSTRTRVIVQSPERPSKAQAVRGRALTPNPSPAARARGTQSTGKRMSSDGAASATGLPEGPERLSKTQAVRGRALSLNPSPAARARGTQSTGERMSSVDQAPRIPLPRPRPVVRHQARENRKAPTRSEELFWRALRNRQFAGQKFRREQPVGRFILDFYCAVHRLAVEVDGGIHLRQKEADQIRQQAIESLGIRFVRVSAELVETNVEAALKQIEVVLRDVPSPAPGRVAGSEAS